MTMHSLVLSLTFFRILAAPFVFIVAIFLENYWLSFWLFNLAALTDYADGKLARSFQVESRLGAILDPIGDKLLLLFALITLIVSMNDVYIAFMSVLILAREFWVNALREYTSANKMSKKTEVTFIAKAKTTFQFIAISMFFLGIAADLAMVTFLATFTLLIALLLSLKSAIDYSMNTFNN